jgi:hypothetical protein
VKKEERAVVLKNKKYNFYRQNLNYRKTIFLHGSCWIPRPAPVPPEAGARTRAPARFILSLAVHRSPPNCACSHSSPRGLVGLLDADKARSGLARPNLSPPSSPPIYMPGAPAQVRRRSTSWSNSLKRRCHLVARRGNGA